MKMMEEKALAAADSGPMFQEAAAAGGDISKKNLVTSGYFLDMAQSLEQIKEQKLRFKRISTIGHALGGVLGKYIQKKTAVNADMDNTGHSAPSNATLNQSGVEGGGQAKAKAEKNQEEVNPMSP